MVHKLTIGKKLISSFGAMLATTIALTLGAFWQVTSLTRALDEAYVTAQKEILAGQIGASTAQMTIAQESILLGTLLTKPQMVANAKEKFRSEMARTQKSLSDDQALMDTEDASKTLSPLQQSLTTVNRAYDDLLASADKSEFDKLQTIFDDSVLPRAAEMGTQAQNLVDHEKEDLTALTKTADANSARGVWLSALLLLAILGAGGAVLFVIRQANGQLRSLAVEVATGSQRVGRAAAQVSSASQSLAQYASEQAAALEQTSASMEEMRSVTHKNNDNSRGTADLMNASMEKVGAAELTIREMSVSMHEISVSGEKITKVVKLIDDIAFQTKILSLNAAVEAARAGSAGAGFAVVAEQVGHLAQECAEAARSTAEMIDGTVAGVRDGSQKLVKAAEAIQDVVKHSTQVKVLVDEVHMGSQEQARGIDQVARAVTQMQEVTQKTASNAEEGAASGRELDGHADRLNKLVGRMHELVGGTQDHGKETAGDSFQDESTGVPLLYSPSSASPNPALSNLGRVVDGKGWSRSGDAAGANASYEAELPLDSEFKEF